MLKFIYATKQTNRRGKEGNNRQGYRNAFYFSYVTFQYSQEYQNIITWFEIIYRFCDIVSI